MPRIVLPQAESVAMMGQSDSAMAILQGMYEDGDPNLRQSGIQPLLAPLHDDPRFVALLEKIGLAPVPQAVEWDRQGRTVLHVVVDGQVAGIVAVEDEIRPESKDAVDALHGLGVRVAMITGDSPALMTCAPSPQTMPRWFARASPIAPTTAWKSAAARRCGNAASHPDIPDAGSQGFAK